MANWKWAEKLLGKEEAYISEEDDVEYGDEGYVDTPRAAAQEAPRQTSTISSSASAALEMKIVLNLENTNKETIRRILDFLTGTTYAIEGKIKRAANSTYVITPKNVDVSADLEQAPAAQKELY